VIRDALLALGVVLSFASQLSLPGLPFGYGELFLALWIILSVARILGGGRVERSPTLGILAVFWLMLAFGVGIGLFIGYFIDLPILPEVAHDVAAYALAAAMTCLAAAEPHADRRLRRCAWITIAVANAALAIQIALGQGWIHQSGIASWYADRLRGWSENPNQLALYCALFGPIALHLATTARSRGAMLLAITGLILPFYVGRLTKSDTFLYATIVAGAVFLGLRLRNWLKASDRPAGLGKQLAVLLLAAALPVAASATPFVVGDAGKVETFAKSLTKDNGGEATIETVDLRVFLWKEALQRGLASASLGLGPGPHVRAPTAIDSQFSSPPMEAHDTTLDLYTQGGLIAVLAFLWLVFSAALSAWRARLEALAALVASVVVFSLPHLIVRHPIVWFSLLMCLVAGNAGAPTEFVRDKG
jgi:O-Antigen ligase